MKQLNNIKIEFGNGEKKIFYELFNGSKKITEFIEFGDRDTDIGKGVENNARKKRDKEDLEDFEDPLYVDPKFIQDVMYYIIPLICLLNIDNDILDFNKMYNNVLKTRKELLYNQLNLLWKNSSKKISKFIKMSCDKYLKENKEFQVLVKRVKKLFKDNLNDIDKLSGLVDEYLVPSDLEKKNNAEISTPKFLRKEMLDKFSTTSKSFFKKPRRVLEPCSGKGGFLVDLVSRFMDGLKDFEPDQDLRYKLIVEKCIYFVDINPLNIYICKTLLDPFKKYKLNFHEGDSLKFNDWKDFDLVVGNPPYNSSGSTATGNTIYQIFTKKALESLIKSKGYLLFVHPPGWRKPNSSKGKFYKMFELMSHENQMVYLSIHNTKDGMKTFKCGTRYDWFIIKTGSSKIKKTIVSDENNNVTKINMLEWSWLPNYNIENVKKLLANKDEERCPIIYSRSAYGSDKKWTSHKKDNDFKYQLIHSTPKKGGPRYMYSKVNDNGHFKQSKIIFGQTGINDVIIDKKGLYGMTEHAIGISVDKKTSLVEYKKMKTALESFKFKEIIKSCMWSNFMIDWRLFTSFKKDFWKELD
jgi:hypothetical protein